MLLSFMNSIHVWPLAPSQVQALRPSSVALVARWCEVALKRASNGSLEKDSVRSIAFNKAKFNTPNHQICTYNDIRRATERSRVLNPKDSSIPIPVSCTVYVLVMHGIFMAFNGKYDNVDLHRFQSLSELLSSEEQHREAWNTCSACAPCDTILCCLSCIVLLCMSLWFPLCISVSCLYWTTLKIAGIPDPCKKWTSLGLHSVWLRVNDTKLKETCEIHCYLLVWIMYPQDFPKATLWQEMMWLFSTEPQIGYRESLVAVHVNIRS